MNDLRKRGAVAAVLGAALGIGADLLVHSTDPVVSSDYVSYPLSSSSWAWFQVFFAGTQALLAAGVIALVRSDLVAPGRARTVTAALAGIGMASTVPGELLLIAAAGSKNDSNVASTVSTVYGVLVLVTDAGLIGYGVLAMRQHARPVALAALPVILGVFHLLVLTPVSLAAGFGSDASFAVFTVSYLLYAAIGVLLLRAPQLSAPGAGAAAATSARLAARP